MASKKSSEPKKDLFADLDQHIKSDKSKTGTGASKPAAAAPARKEKDKDAVTDSLGDLDSMLKSSRPQTPRPASSAAKKAPSSVTGTPAAAAATEEKVTAGQSSTDGSTGDSEKASAVASEEKVPASEEPTEVAANADNAAGGGGGGGWWGGFGGLMGAASAAVKQAQSQAEQLARELQKNEEAQKWAEHVKGNAALLRSYGGDLRNITGEIRSRALPGLTNLLHTLAPPISSHERLQVHITHDMTGYPSLDPLVHSVFARVMAQVEGGDLLVLQRGHESGPRSSDQPTSFSSTAGWSDGPWWRDQAQKRDIGAVTGLVEGSKLARASAEGFADEYFLARGGVDEARRAANAATLSETNPTRSSDIFLAVQAITQARTTPENKLFAGSAESASGKNKEKDSAGTDGAEVSDDDDAEIAFAIYLHDPVHSLAFGAVTQAIPSRWVLSWLDLPDPSVAAKGSTEESKTGEEGAESAGAGHQQQQHLPADIADIVRAGGVDPREWAAEWIEEALALGVGVVAQRYVARRMGVGEVGKSAGAVAGIRTGKAEEAGAGELARAM